MRRGIGLRGYAQQDPLNEFRREAFRMYEELRGLIRHGVASTIFRVTVSPRAGAPDGGAAPGARAGQPRAAGRARADGAGRHGATAGADGRRVDGRGGGIGRRPDAAAPASRHAGRRRR